MRFQIRQLTFLLILSALTNFVNVHATDIHSNDWDITLNPNHSFTFNYKGKTLLKNAYARAISSDNDELLEQEQSIFTLFLDDKANPIWSRFSIYTTTITTCLQSFH